MMPCDAAAERRARGDGRAQHVAGGELDHAARARPDALAWVPLPAAGGPNRIRFITPLDLRSAARSSAAPLSFDFLISPSYWWASRCDWIWATVSMVTDTTIRIEVPPNIVGAPVVAGQEFRQQADDGDIDRADHGQAGQHVVDVFRRPLARPDAGQVAAVLAQVLGRLVRIEDHRGVEEAEEDDQQRRRATMKAGWPWLQLADEARQPLQPVGKLGGRHEAAPQSPAAAAARRRRSAGSRRRR